jgi:basic membrane protein A
MKKIIILLTLFMFMLFLNACTGVESLQDPEGNNIHIVFMTNSNAMDSNDDTNMQIKDALKSMESNNGIVTSVVEVKDKESYSSMLKNLSDSEEYDLIITVGYSTSKILDNIAKDYPDQLFATIDYISNEDNVLSIAFREEESSFYNGVLAALMTQTDIIGCASSFENQNMQYIYGFITGARAVNPDIEIDLEYTGSYTDLEAGAEVGKKFLDQGADIIYSCAAAPTSSIIEFAEKNEMKVINSDIYEYGQISDALFCTTTKQYKSSVEYIVNAAVEIISSKEDDDSRDIDTELRYVGIAQEAFKFDFSKEIDSSIEDKLKAVDIMFLNSELVVPNDESTFANFDTNIFEGKAFRK